MRCLYVVPNSPISPNYSGGGSSIFYEQLVSLTRIGVKVSLWHFCYESRSDDFESFVSTDIATWQRVQAMCERIHRTVLPDKPGLADRAKNKVANMLTGFHVENPSLRGTLLRKFKELARDVEPDFVWAQHLPSASVAVQQAKVPVVYSHHDWLYKVKGLNGNTAWGQRSKKTEEEVVRRASAVVSGSYVECDQLREVGSSNVHYIPVAYETVQPSEKDSGAAPRLVHLGGLGTTANRIGLERFFDVVWPNIKIDRSNMLVVGDMTLASDKMKRHLQQVTSTGYVEDLSRVIRAHDVHIIPWEHDTGQRTRLVLAFNYCQAVVAIRKSVSCYPEAVDGENCILVDSLEDMASAIHRLLFDDDLRRRLGENARKTFEASFTRKVLLPKYEKVIESVVR